MQQLNYHEHGPQGGLCFACKASSKFRQLIRILPTRCSRQQCFSCYTLCPRSAFLDCIALESGGGAIRRSIMAKDHTSTSGETDSKGTFDYGTHFGTMRVLGDILRTEDRRPWMTSVPKTPDHRKYVIWMGCHVLRVPHLAEALDDILLHLKEDYVSLGGASNCCGIAHEANGDLDVSKNMLKQTLGKLEAFTPEKMLYWCPSCDNQVRESKAERSELVEARGSVVHFLA